MVKKVSKFYVLRKKLKYLLVGKKEKRIPFWFEIHVNDNCNLNCSGCDHFAPLAKENSNYDLQKYENDIKRIAELFGDEVGHLHIMGGEPLINNNINRYLEISRKYLKTAQLQLITNGILLKSMPESFFKCCKLNDIEICVSTYPIGLNYDELYKFVRSKGVFIETFNVRSISNVWKNMGLSNKKEDLLPYKKTFLTCKYSNNCANMRDGKLYFCPHAAYIGLFNEFFNESFDTDDTGIDIYTNDRNTILDFLRIPHTFCKYCHINDKNNKRTNWKVSNKEKEEWTKNY